MPDSYTIDLRQVAFEGQPSDRAMWLNTRKARPVPELVWLDADAMEISKREPIEPPMPLAVEIPMKDGQLGWVEHYVLPTIVGDPPTGAVAAKLYFSDVAVMNVPMRAVKSAAPLSSPPDDFIGDANAPFKVFIVAERFSDRKNFQDEARTLFDFITAHEPFARAKNEGLLAARLLYWPSDPSVGMFDTPDPPAQGDDRRFFGDMAAARAQLLPWFGLRGRVFVLINSTARGGAGGNKFYPAWGSTGGGDWKEVALHELGHSLGLADEYTANGPIDIEYANEPNVSKNPVPSQVSWHKQVNVSSDDVPSHPIGKQAGVALDVIGTFQGAFYSNEWYRPTANCLMRTVALHSAFCPVCQKKLASELGLP